MAPRRYVEPFGAMICGFEEGGTEGLVCPFAAKNGSLRVGTRILVHGRFIFQDPGPDRRRH